MGCSPNRGLGRCVSDLDTTIPHLSSNCEKTALPSKQILSLATRCTIQAMAGTKEIRDRSESQEQDEVWTQPALGNTVCDAEPRVSSNRTSTPPTKNKKPARQNRVGRRIQSATRFVPCFSRNLIHRPIPRLHRHRAYVAPPSLHFRYHFSSSQAARRDQNRIAQREFRLRKQQRVRTSFAPAGLAMQGDGFVDDSRFFRFAILKHP